MIVKKYAFLQKLFTFFFFFFFIILIASGQSKSIAIKGDILNEESDPVSNCNIRIASRKTKLILAFFNTGTLNSFSKTINTEFNDTLIVTVSHTSFISQTEEIIIDESRDNSPVLFSFKLQYNIHQLQEVILLPIPVWSRGDTTFFKVDSFKVGNEKKLIDLLVKMPGFTITSKGHLMFKGRAVEKIFLEGEEIFAEKIKLLLQSMPIHNINTIQALENQANNRLLKGLLNDNKVFLNLSFKKGKNNLNFGDIEAGVRSDNKYTIAPNLFSLQKKLKVGFIGNVNSTGQGIFEYEFTPFFSEPIRNSWTNMININNLQYVFELGGDRYLQNKLFSNNLQLNYHFNKKIYAKTEINIINDQLTQKTFSTSRVFGNDSFFSREDQNSILYSPKYYVFKQDIQILPDSLSSLSITFEKFSNKSESSFSTSINQNVLSYNTNNFIGNNSSNSIIAINYTNRISQNKASTLNLSYNINRLPQLVNGYSKDWYNLFSLPDSSYTMLVNNFSNTHNILSLNFESIFKHKGITRTFHIEGFHAKYSIENILAFERKNSNLPSLINPDFTTQGNYEVSKFLCHFLIQSKINNRVFAGFVNSGLARIAFKDSFNEKKIIQPQLLLSVSGKKSYSRFISDEIEIKYSQSSAGLNQLNSVYLPSNYISFYRNRNVGIQDKNILGSYRLYSSLKNFNSFILSLTVNKFFTGNLSDPVYFGFILLRSDSAIKKNGNSSTTLATSVNILSIKLFTVIKAGFSIQKNNGLLLIQNKATRVKYSSSDLYLELRRNWGKKIFLTNHFILRFINNKSLLFDLQSKSSLANFFNNFSFRYFFSKKVDVKYSFEILNNNLYSNSNSFYFLSNIYFRYFTAKSKMSLSLKLNNITNEKNYYGIGANTEFIQNVFAIPLVKRNLLFALSYEF